MVVRKFKFPEATQLTLTKDWHKDSQQNGLQLKKCAALHHGRILDQYLQEESERGDW
jgi:hypothetical protein